MSPDENGTRTEEERNLTHGVHYNVQRAAHGSGGIGHGRSEDNVGKLGDGGIRKSRLEIVLVRATQEVNKMVTAQRQRASRWLPYPPKGRYQRYKR